MNKLFDDFIYNYYNILKIFTFNHLNFSIGGLGIGVCGLGPIPNPQSPIPNPQSPFNILLFNNFLINYYFLK